jgi:hypothetical protein
MNRMKGLFRNRCGHLAAVRRNQALPFFERSRAFPSTQSSAMENALGGSSLTAASSSAGSSTANFRIARPIRHRSLMATLAILSYLPFSARMCAIVFRAKAE